MSFNEAILSTDVQDFILKNESIEPNQVALKKAIFSQVSNSELAQQIESRRKAKKKLPTWYMTDGIYYPKPCQLNSRLQKKRQISKRN